jgi:hypothetical protein
VFFTPLDLGTVQTLLLSTQAKLFLGAAF